MNLDDIRWHDGNIQKLELIPNDNGISEVILHLELYDDSSRTEGRDKFIFNCKNVSGFNSICDMEKIIENSEFGSIHDGKISNNILRLSMYEGYIEIHANEFVAKKC